MKNSGSGFFLLLLVGVYLLAPSIKTGQSLFASDLETEQAKTEIEAIHDKELDQPDNQTIATEKTDASDDQQLREWLSIVSDNTLELHKREMPAYWRLLELARDEPYQSMIERSRKSPAFSDFYLRAAQHRGELVSLEVNIRRVLKYPVQDGNPGKIESLYEIWGWTNQAKSWLYVFVTPELPDGMNEGKLVNQTATFSGYFFKLQAYHSGMARQNNQPLVAPLLIGKFGSTKPVVATRSTTNFGAFSIFVAVLVVCAVSFIMRLYLSSPKKYRMRTATSESDSSLTQSHEFDWIDSFENVPKEP